MKAAIERYKVTPYKLLFILLFILMAVQSLTSCTNKYISAHDPQWIDLPAGNHGFALRVLSNRPISQVQGSSNRIHVYMGGDGRPFLRARYISPDPTSKQAFAIKLMQQDTAPAIYLTRPCYHQVVKSQRCSDSRWWTSHRYASEVVETLAQALNALGLKRIHLIGFSGGGSLAILVAAQLQQQDTAPKVELITTISANLDHTAWTNFHGFTPLFGSLNASEYLEQLRIIPQTHLVGLKDKNVPYKLWYSDSLSWLVLRKYPDANHHCCWLSEWPRYLATLHGATLDTPD